MNQDNVGARLAALVARPGQAMEWVAERPQWLTAGIILFLAVGSMTMAIVHISGPEQIEMVRDSRLGRMMTEQDHQERMTEAVDPSLGKRAINGLGGGFGVWIGTLVFSAVILLFSKLAGGEGTFKQIAGITYWAMLVPYLLGSLIKLPLIFATQSVMGVSIGLAAIAQALGAEVDSALYQALYMFGDFLVWWSLAIMVIGMEKVNGFARPKAATVVILPWLLMTGVMFGLNRLVS